MKKWLKKIWDSGIVWMVIIFLVTAFSIDRTKSLNFIKKTEGIPH